MRRRKPDSMEVQQMKTQAKEEKSRFLILSIVYVYIYFLMSCKYKVIYLGDKLSAIS